MKNKIYIFIFSLIMYVLIMVIISHTCEVKGIPPQKWSEIIHDWLDYLSIGLITAGITLLLIDSNKKNDK